MTNVRQLLYVSNTSRDLPQDALDAILASARRNNSAVGVTGMLLYLDGAFLQVLEGADDAVSEIYERIATDRRHWNPQVLLDRKAQRVFTQWSMGFERLVRPGDGSFVATAPHLKDLIDPAQSLELSALVQTFYKINARD